MLKSLQHEKFTSDAEVSILLVDDQYIHKLNLQYRMIDKPTDVLSFSQIEGSELLEFESAVALGDIVISIDTAQRQADSGGRSLDDELEILTIHGMLHLLGYDDSDDVLADIMREREKGILNGLIHERNTGKS
ncbi:MAG: rRNA maturation RNase YbeY [Armatimonadota bacterium]